MPSRMPGYSLIAIKYSVRFAKSLSVRPIAFGSGIGLWACFWRELMFLAAITCFCPVRFLNFSTTSCDCFNPVAEYIDNLAGFVQFQHLRLQLGDQIEEFLHFHIANMNHFGRFLKQIVIVIPK